MGTIGQLVAVAVLAAAGIGAGADAWARPGIHVPFHPSIVIGPRILGLDAWIDLLPSMAAVEDGERPFAFAAPMPNPAAGHTIFRFRIPEEDEVTLELMDLTGARVRTLIAARTPAGSHARGWDLRDDRGRRVPPGVYLSRLTVGLWCQTRRLAVVR